MPNYEYAARDISGQIIRGRAEAENEKVLAQRLAREGYKVVSIRREKVAGAGFAIPFFGGVKIADLAIFSRQFSTMIDAGVTLVKALSVLEEQTTSGTLRKVINQVRRDVEGGESLSRAMAKHPRVFSDLYVGLVRAGEVGGALEEVLQRIAKFLEDDLALRRKVKGALTYPIIVVGFALMIILILVTFVVPRFIQMIAEITQKTGAEQELPPLTRGLMSFSQFVIHKWYWIIAILVGLFMVYRVLKSTRWGKRAWDFLMLKAPVIGKLSHKLALARFARTLATLLGSGVPILQAMETTAGTVGNSIIGDAIMEARARIREGDPIAGPMQKSKYFPPMVVHMVSVGEESGALDDMLLKIAEFYEQEVDTAIQSLSDAIQPVVLVLLGGAVLVILIALWGPIITVLQKIGEQGGGG
jgi:type IV pilus assembly protein PilC